MLQYIDTISIENKKVLLRVDYNVTLTKDHAIANDYRITQSIPTIEHLVKNNNTLVIVTHLGRPEGREVKYSLKPVVDHLNKLLPKYTVKLVDRVEDALLMQLDQKTIYVLENIRFYPEEKKNDPAFAKKLSDLADVYVNDAFGVSHRSDASVVGVTEHLPSYAGLLVKKEIEMIDRFMSKPQHPVVAIIGGAKVSTKIGLIEKLMEVADYLLVGGGIGNTFYSAKGYEIGSSIYEPDAVDQAKELINLSQKKKTNLLLPTDVVLGDIENPDGDTMVAKPDMLDTSNTRAILDIGPDTQTAWGHLIAQAKTIIWNGPVGYAEQPAFSHGTDFVYKSIVENDQAFSLVGGGETLAAVSEKESLDKITHVSTGGGAMLEYIEKGTLPGLIALGEVNRKL